MGIIAYELLVLGVASLFIQQKWIIRIRKYVMMFFGSSGMILLTISFKYDEELFVYLLVCTIIFIALFIVALVNSAIKKKTRIEELLYLPEGGYEIVIADNYRSSDVQIKYFLKYNKKMYLLSTVPPKGTPPLIMYVEKNEGIDIMTASIAIDDSAQPITVGRIMKKMRYVLVFVATTLLPILYQLWANKVIQENYMDNCLTLVVGCYCAEVTRGSKALLPRCVFYFCRFLEMSGWLITFVELVLSICK